MKTQDYHLPFESKVIAKSNCIFCNKKLDEKIRLRGEKTWETNTSSRKSRILRNLIEYSADAN